MANNTVMNEITEDSILNVDIYARGEDGRGLSSITTTYQAGNSGTVKPTGGTWSSTIPSVDPGKFLWSKMVYTFTDETTYEVYSVAGMGATGSQGPRGYTGSLKIYIVDVLPTTSIESDAFYAVPVAAGLATENKQYDLYYYIEGDNAHWEILKSDDIKVTAKDNSTTYYVTGSLTNTTGQKQLYGTGITYTSGANASTAGTGAIDGQDITTGLYYSIE